MGSDTKMEQWVMTIPEERKDKHLIDCLQSEIKRKDDTIASLTERLNTPPNLDFLMGIHAGMARIGELLEIGDAEKDGYFEFTSRLWDEVIETRNYDFGVQAFTKKYHEWYRSFVDDGK